jgi:hypothetical protein
LAGRASQCGHGESPARYARQHCAERPIPATDRTTLTVTQDPEAYAADVAIGGAEKGAMVVLHHNDSATGRTQLLPLEVGEPVPVPVPVG